MHFCSKHPWDCFCINIVEIANDEVINLIDDNEGST
jgi:hypothetical protein